MVIKTTKETSTVIFHLY